MSWCWCLRVLGADCWNDLQVVVINIRVNWCAVIGWIGEPAVQYKKTKNTINCPKKVLTLN